MPKKPEEFTSSERLFVKSLLIPWKLRAGAIFLTPLALRATIFSEAQFSTAGYIQQYGIDPERYFITVLGSGFMLLASLLVESGLKRQVIFSDESGPTFVKGIVFILALTYALEITAQVSEPALRCLLVPAIMFYLTSFAVSRMYPEE